MILLRGVRGHSFAKEIESGQISCRDLLSIVTDARTSGYKFAHYFERYFVTAFKQLHYVSNDSDKSYIDIQLALNSIVPYMYMTYYHIINENSEKWLEESFDSDYEFFYFIPKLDKNTGELIARDFTGQRMKYVDCIDPDVDLQKGLINHWPITLVDSSDELSFRKSSALALSYNALLYPLFQRVRDDQFGDIENEFRIIKFVLPRIDNKLEVVYDNPRIFRIHAGGDYYQGKVVKLQVTPFPNEKKNMVLINENPLVCNKRVYLSDLYFNGLKIEYCDQFVHSDIRNYASEYGYIGNKSACLEFIKKAKKSVYYTYNDTQQIISSDFLDFNKTSIGKKWFPNYPIVDYKTRYE